MCRSYNSAECRDEREMRGRRVKRGGREEGNGAKYFWEG